MGSPNTAGVVLQGEVVLESRGLRKSFGTGGRKLEVLTDANLELREGEMVAIVAPSGAGKSTLLHLLGALDTPTSGTVYFANKAIETNEDAALAQFRNRAVGFLWQRHQLLPGPRVLLADEPTGDLDEQNAWAVFELLERLHRTHRLTSLIATHNLALAARCDRVVGLEHGVLRTRSVRADATGTPGGEAS